MDFRIRIFGMICLFLFYIIQCALIASPLFRDTLMDDNEQSYLGFFGVDILLILVTFVYLLLKWMGLALIDRLIVLFDSFLFAFSYAWMVLAAPVANDVAGFFIVNFLVATGIFFVDLCEFRQFSHAYQRKRSTSNGINEEMHMNEMHATHDADIENQTTSTVFSTDSAHRRRMSEEEVHRSVAERSSANAREVKYMPDNLDLTKKGVLDGFRVNLQLLPEIDDTIPRDLPWSTFTNVVHSVDSSSCHIYTAMWGTTPVILKLIKEDRITSAVALAEFDIEERVLSRVRHPHIVRLLGSGSIPRKYLVLEYLSGGTLSHTLGVRPDKDKQRWLKKFTLLETFKLAHGLAEALNYLHNDWCNSIHIIHRDLKPDNIGWSSDGVLKLFDFGLSVSVRAQRDRTEQYRLTGNTGTLRYMAPEVVLGRSYNQTVDTYSFGILIWQVAAGQIPFREMGKKSYFDKVVIKGVRPAIDSAWPVEFVNLLQACWHEDKNSRPSFADVTSVLAQLVVQQEEIERAHNNNCCTQCITRVIYYVRALHPLYALFAVILLGVSFILSTQKDSDFVISGCVLGFFSSLALYSSLINYFCDAWPLVPLQDNNTIKPNFQIDYEGSHLHAPRTNPTRGKNKDHIRRESGNGSNNVRRDSNNSDSELTAAIAQGASRSSLTGTSASKNTQEVKDPFASGTNDDADALHIAQPQRTQRGGILGNLGKNMRGRGGNSPKKGMNSEIGDDVTFSPLNSHFDV